MLAPAGFVTLPFLDGLAEARRPGAVRGPLTAGRNRT